MPKVLEIRELADFLEEINQPAIKAANKAMIVATNRAASLAKQFTKQVFEGTPERPKQGQLMNSIFAGFEPDGQLLQGYVAVRAKYGRIHEYGGTIVPKRSKYLWIPMTGRKTKGLPGRFKNMSPRDFIAQMERNTGGRGGYRSARASKKNNKQTFTRGEFAIFPGESGQLMAWFVQKIGAGKRMRTSLIPIFMLRKKVVMPKRPYIQPAIEQVYPTLPERIRKYFLEK